MLQGEAVGLLVEGGHAVGVDFHWVVPVASVDHGMEDPDVGAEATDDQLLGFQRRQACLSRSVS